MKTENTNDFSKRRVGDKLWSIQLGDCIVSELTLSEICVISDNGIYEYYYFDGKFSSADKYQSLFFSNPNIIAPPEPPRLPDYKPGQWIAVWENFSIPNVRKFVRFIDNRVICYAPGTDDEVDWKNHCTLEELPEVLARWGEPK